MTTLTIVGAGPGLGGAVARRFGTEGFDIALISRRQQRVDVLAADLTAASARWRRFSTAPFPRPRSCTRFSTPPSTTHASKHAVIGLTKSAAKEYGPHGVRINAVCPGTIDTPMVTDMVTTGALDRTRAVAATPLGRLGRPEEIAAAALWLKSPGASFVNGSVLLVDGGQLA
ncbi:MAG TPA: SDR family oxidoreductase [Microlunatus sp.]|nr:SDR family oxidoreductase [Microlunatus sp.]